MHTFNNSILVFSLNILCSFALTSPMASQFSSDSAHVTPLHRAAFEGHDEEVERLVQMGADVKARNCFGRTPLHDAIHSESSHIVGLLLACEADPNVIDNDGMTPLFNAVQLNNITIVELLIKAGADVNRPVKTITPLHRAVYDKRLNIIRLLIAHGAAINARNMFGRTPMHDLCIGYCGSTYSEDSPISLMNAVLDGNPDLSIRDNKGRTPLWLAVRNCWVLGPSSIERLLAKGANPNIYAKGITPLHYAASHARTEISAVLCRYGANVNAQNCFGKTPLHDALDYYYTYCPVGTSYASAPIIKLLVEYGALTNIVDCQGRTPLSIDQQGCLRWSGRHGHCYQWRDKGYLESVMKINLQIQMRLQALTMAQALNERLGSQSPANLLSVFDIQEIFQILKKSYQ